ncbi:hypothetical protein ABTW35_12855, partial [Morganella morganii]
MLLTSMAFFFYGFVGMPFYFGFRLIRNPEETHYPPCFVQTNIIINTGYCRVLMNPLMILVKIIKLRWIHILSYDQMVSRKINNQTTRCANSIF